MRLFIRIRNGRAYEHPIFEDNFKQAFPDVNIEDLPDGFAEFDRVPQPMVGHYEVYEGVTYEWVGHRMQDVHHVRPMTEQEKLAKQQAVKDEWVVSGFPSWTFNEATCAFDPPVPMPDDDALYRWDEPTLAWVEVQPTEGQ